MNPSTQSQCQSSPTKASNPSRLFCHRLRKTPALTHSWKRLWAVECLHRTVLSRAIHWQPVFITYQIASAARRSSTRER